MNLAKVAELTKVSPRMLRYYESLGLYILIEQVIIIEAIHKKILKILRKLKY